MRNFFIFLVLGLASVACTKKADLTLVEKDQEALNRASESLCEKGKEMKEVPNQSGKNFEQLINDFSVFVFFTGVGQCAVLMEVDPATGDSVYQFKIERDQVIRLQKTNNQKQYCLKNGIVWEKARIKEVDSRLEMLMIPNTELDEDPMFMSGEPEILGQDLDSKLGFKAYDCY